MSALPLEADVRAGLQDDCFVPRRLNRSRGRALRHGRASNGWNDESVYLMTMRGQKHVLEPMIVQR